MLPSLLDAQDSPIVDTVNWSAGSESVGHPVASTTVPAGVPAHWSSASGTPSPSASLSPGDGGVCPSLTVYQMPHFPSGIKTVALPDAVIRSACMSMTLMVSSPELAAVPSKSSLSSVLEKLGKPSLVLFQTVLTSPVSMFAAMTS